MNGSLMTAEQSNRAKSWQDTKETTEGGGGGGGGEGRGRSRKRKYRKR